MLARRAYQYRLYPTPAQADALTWILARCRELYNACLEERREAYRKAGVSVGYYDQKRQLPGVKAVRPEYARIGSQVLQDVTRRLDRAFAAFFRRIKAGEKPGYPRFKSRDRYHSFTLSQAGWSLDQRPHLAGIGDLKVKWSRPIEGTIKTVIIRRDADAWFVSFSCLVEVADPLPDPALPEVGIDVGLEHFATLSDGTHIANPRHLRTGQATLTRRQQALARKKRGSKRRKQARLLVAKAHRTIRRQRHDFHHQTARRLVRAHGLIAVEALQIHQMVRRPKPLLGVDAETEAEVSLPNGVAAKAGLNKSIADAGWGSFLTILGGKAAEAGCRFVAWNQPGRARHAAAAGRTVPRSYLSASIRVRAAAARSSGITTRPRLSCTVRSDGAFRRQRGPNGRA